MKKLFEKNLIAEVAAFKKDGKYFCGNCAKEVEKGNETCPRCKSELIYDSWGASLKVMYNTRITLMENDNKLLMNIFEGKTTFVNGKFRFQKYICPYCFDFKTGQSYKLPVLNGETRRPLKKGGNGIKNISYNPSEILSAVNVVREEMSEIFTSKASQYVHYVDEINRLKSSKSDDIKDFMLSLTKFKYCDKATEAIVHSQYTERKLKPARKYWLKPKARENTEKALKAHYPSDIWKGFENDFRLFSNAYKIGYLKPDNQRKMVQEILSLQKLNDSCKFNRMISASYINSFVDLIKLSDNENEMMKRVCKMISSNPHTSEWVINDATYMLQKVKDRGMDVKRILRLKTFDEMHDAAEEAYDELKTENKIIPVSPKEKKIELYRR